MLCFIISKNKSYRTLKKYLFHLIVIFIIIQYFVYLQVALASFPGSGNTWLRHLIEHISGVVRNKFVNVVLVP